MGRQAIVLSVQKLALYVEVRVCRALSLDLKMRC